MLKMNFVKELKFLCKLDLYTQLFKKNLKKLFNECENYIIFVVVIRMNENEDGLYYSEILSEPDMSKLRN